MKALLGKELRENLKWAFLAMVCLAGGLLYGLYHTPYGRLTFDSYEGVTLLRKQFLLVTTFGFPAAGLFLGLMQVLPEQKRDRWAALLHRPIPPGRILLGKMLAGLVLYGLASGVPFLMAVWLAATPGNFAAPFVPGMVLAGLADLMVGSVYYLAAFGIVLPRTGWFQRGLPLLAAVDISFLVLNVNLFRVAAGSAAAMAITLAIAAMGMIREPASWSRRSALQRLALLAVAFFGLCGLADLGRSLLDAVGPEPRRSWMDYEITKNGMPVRLAYTNGVVTEVTDGQGRPLEGPEFSIGRVRNEMAYLSGVSSYIGDSHGWKPREWIPTYRQTGRYFGVGNSYSFPQSEQWFGFVPERSWICYQPLKKLPVARLDAAGFQEPSAIPQPLPQGDAFEELRSDCYVIWNDQSVRLAYLAARRIKELILPAPLPLYGLGTASAQSPKGQVRVTGFALGEGLALYDEAESFISLLPYSQDVSRWGNIQFGVSPERDRYFLWYRPSQWIDRKESKTMPSFLDVVDSQGRVLTSTKLEPLPDSFRETPLSQWLTQRLHSPSLYFGEMAYRKVGALMGSKRLENALNSQLRERWPETRQRIAWILGLSGLCATVAWLMGRKAGMGGRSLLAWVLFIFAFNLAGLLVFRLMADWPRLVPCPACRRKRPVAGEVCPHCRGVWKSPEPKGIEILDHQTVPSRPA